MLTYLADPADEAKLKSLHDEDEGFRFWGPVFKTKDGKRKLRFVVPEPSVPKFNGLVGKLGTLVSSSRKNQKLIDSVTTIRLAITEDFWQDTLPYPPLDEELWWEIWLRGNRQDANETFHRFVDIAAAIGINRVSDRYVSFPERLVLHAYASARQLSSSIHLLSMIAELRKAKELATPYVTMSARDQRDFVDDAARLIVPPGRNAPSVCILDAGVNQPHPLLAPALAPEDVQAVEAEWGTADHDDEQHGTGMAGIALYGCLTGLMTATGPVILRHRLESVKFLPPPPQYNEPPVYGRVMQDAVALAQIQSPRRNRVICMAVTADDREMGMPTTWSAAADDMCAGVLDEIPKLMFISAGNVLPEDLYSAEYAYHNWNTTRAGIEDPGQSWNAITVGAYTEKVFIEDPSFSGWQPIAESGDLTPTSRTSLPWPEKNRKGWPIKPDIVMEGGNYAQRGGDRSNIDDLSLLTTILHPSGRLLEVTRDTSPATALAARFAATIWSRYPRFRPETVRGLMVHSASWTEAMRRRYPGSQKSVAQNCLRCYGYGVPDLGKALSSAENAATLIYEGDIQPFCKTASGCKTARDAPARPPVAEASPRRSRPDPGEHAGDPLVFHRAKPEQRRLGREPPLRLARPQVRRHPAARERARVQEATIQDRVGCPQRPTAERRRNPRVGDREQRQDARFPPLGLVGGKGHRPLPLQPDRGLSGDGMVEGTTPSGATRPEGPLQPHRDHRDARDRHLHPHLAGRERPDGDHDLSEMDIQMQAPTGCLSPTGGTGGSSIWSGRRASPDSHTHDAGSIRRASNSRPKTQPARA